MHQHHPGLSFMVIVHIYFKTASDNLGLSVFVRECGYIFRRASAILYMVECTDGNPKYKAPTTVVLVNPLSVFSSIRSFLFYDRRDILVH